MVHLDHETRKLEQSGADAVLVGGTGDMVICDLSKVTSADPQALTALASHHGLDGTPGPDGWSSWAYSTGYADYKTNPADTFTRDGSPYINAGNWGAWWDGGGGWYQVVPAAEGMTFTLSVDCATEDWDSAAGEMRLIYSDATATTIRQDVLHTAEYLASQPWTPFSLTTTAPAGTTQLKVEFATWGARGTVVWDNASLTVPEPGTLGLLGCGVVLLVSRRRFIA